MWGKYCRIYPEFAQKTSALFKVQYIRYMKIDCLIAQTETEQKMSSEV
jgi:hypothetical protein